MLRVAPSPSRPTSPRSQLQVDNPPDGWARRVLESGRGLLLVDRSDEVPREDRAGAARWLTEVLHRFPKTRCMVTVRPLAVEESWLIEEGFDELRLLPMRDPDIREFVAAWHRAAVGDRGELGLLERDLEKSAARQKFRATGSGSDSTALRRDLRPTPSQSGPAAGQSLGLVPLALAMLLGSRDKQRQIGAAEEIRRRRGTAAAATTRCRLAGARRANPVVERRRGRTDRPRVKGMARVRMNATPERLLTHLLIRSGLLQERSRDAIQFIHRTFQDFLAAKEFRESGALNEVLRHAAEEEWQDVIRLLSGHCDRGQTQKIVQNLIAQGDAADDPEIRADLYVLAAHCAFESAYFEDMDEVEMRLAQLIPPRREDVDRLVWFRPAWCLLPGPEGLSRCDRATRVAQTAAGVRVRKPWRSCDASQRAEISEYDSA